MNLEHRFDGFLKDLALFLPAVSAPQALREYFDGNRKAMMRVLRALEAKGSVTITTEFVRMRDLPDSPILRLARGDSPPSASRIAYQAAKLWRAEIEPVVVIRATGRLVALYGGEPRMSLSAHVSHDIGLSELFHRHRRIKPDYQWCLVHSRPGDGALPDAIAADCAVELLGLYGTAHVRAKLQLAASTNLTLW